MNNECSFEIGRGDAAGYGDWTKIGPIRDEVETPKPLAVNIGERRLAGTFQGGWRVGNTKITSSVEAAGSSMGPAHYEEAHIPRKGLKMWHRVSSRTEDQDKDFQQWLMEGHTLHVTHYVVMGLRQLGP